MGFKVLALGLVEFERALRFQKEIFADVKSGNLDSALILCRHYPVITAGRLAKEENIRVPQSALRKMAIPVYWIERAGDVTYHGPGQITAYPVFNLGSLKKDVHFYLRQLEETVIKLSNEFGITAKRRPGLTGVWIGRDKIASIGIAIRNWITYHGVSVNVKRGDLGNFRLIRPCGMDVKMTSLESALNREIDIGMAEECLVEKFKETFEFTGG